MKLTQDTLACLLSFLVVASLFQFLFIINENSFFWNLPKTWFAMDEVLAEGPSSETIPPEPIISIAPIEQTASLNPAESIPQPEATSADHSSEPATHDAPSEVPISQHGKAPASQEIIFGDAESSTMSSHSANSEGEHIKDSSSSLSHADLPPAPTGSEPLPSNSPAAPHINKLKINILSKFNGEGLKKDAKILKVQLEALGHVVQISQVDEEPTAKADINIFIEAVKENHLPNARKNYFIANPEWYQLDEDVFQKLDLILCRTEESLRIFKEMSKEAYFIGFASEDRFKSMRKERNGCLHLFGKSMLKGTKAIFNAWRQRPDFPQLLARGEEEIFENPQLSNVLFISHFLANEELKKLQNQCMIHLCPSETEGFGHYLMEAMSTGAVVVTTNAPPMNEFISDPRCLVDYATTFQQSLATCYVADPAALERTVESLLELPLEELQKIGEANRLNFISSKAAFEERIKLLFSNQ